MNARELIESAFAGVSYPGDERITDHKGCLECQEIAAYFRGTSWRDHTIEKLWEHRTALSLFTSEAFHYFLPAFMLGTLGHPREADEIPQSISYQFVPDFHNSRTSPGRQGA